MRQQLLLGFYFIQSEQAGSLRPLTSTNPKNSILMDGPRLAGNSTSRCLGKLWREHSKLEIAHEPYATGVFLLSIEQCQSALLLRKATLTCQNFN